MFNILNINYQLNSILLSFHPQFRLFQALARIFMVIFTSNQSLHVF
ncbi:hypothetical protein C900_05812 [Fulvivirga imtechensis AK7]|uniref:Uncharacterized protein n=1 Tax=Fulvivirga imtechensis AK7 TaxID=1237149 RepID=L8JMT4_9BACT|nr:hypothetical protein C900_05812 [Fulvivirga imtechensis AK7]